MSEVIYAAITLAVPFMLGIVAGVEIANRRPKSQNEKLGQLIKDRILSVYEQRRWVARGSGVEVSNTMDFNMPEGRKMQIVIREVA